MRTTSMRIQSFIAAVAAVLTIVTVAHAKSPVQVTPGDGTILIVNKPVGSQQWVLTLDADNLTLSGNVFDTSGAAPTFFFCDVDFSPDEWIDVGEIASETLTFTCQVANGCTTLPCTTDWAPVGGSITLPGSFFLP